MGSGHIEGALLTGFRDDELPAALRAEVASHLGGCEICQARLADLAALGQLLHAQRVESAAELPSDFVNRVMRVLPERLETRSPWERFSAFLVEQRQRLLVGLLVSAVAATLVVVFMPGLRTNNGGEETVENEAQIHRLEVTSPEGENGGEGSAEGDRITQQAVVLQSAEGNTVIWMVPTGTDERGLDGGGVPPAAP